MKKYLILLLVALLSVLSSPQADARNNKGGAAQPSKQQLMGANIGCMACGGVSPGTAFLDWTPPSLSQIQYLSSKNLNVYRLPFKWERAQTTLGGSLNMTYVNYLDQAATDAASEGACVIFDMHNYGTYNGLYINAVGGPTYAQYAQVWGLLAGVLGDNPGTCGFDLMNEPHDMPSNANTPAMYQAAIDEIREVDTNTPLYIQGDAYTSAYGWLGNCSNCGGAPVDGWAVGGNDHLKNLVDPEDKLVFSAHVYGDANSSGVYPDDPEDLFGGPECEGAADSWECAVALGDQLDNTDPTIDTDILVKRFTPFVEWCNTNNLKCHIGESGVPNDNPNWLDVLDNGLQYLQDNNIEFTYWNAAGTINDPLNIDKRANGQDAKQMAVLSKYAKAHPPILASLTGPNRGTEDTLSSYFTYQYNGLVKDTVTITPSDGAASGTFTPSSITIDPGYNATATFRYTAPDAASYTINADSTAGWAPPSGLGYSTIEDYFAEYGIAPTNVYSLNRIFTPYLGPCVRLRRASDNAEMDIGWESNAYNAKCDQATAVTWADGSNLYVVKWYDQSGFGNDAGPVTEDGSAVTPAASNSDQPRFIPNYQNSSPAILWASSRMMANSPIDELTAQTVMAVLKPTAPDTQASLLGFGWNIGGTDVVQGFASDLFTSTIMPVDSFKTYSISSNFNTLAMAYDVASGGTLAVHGTIANRVAASGTDINAPYGDYVTIGFPVFSASRFAGYTTEIIIAPEKLSDNALTDIQADQSTRIAGYQLPAYTYYTPTLDQNIGAENDAPWRGMGGSGGYQYFGVTPTASYAYWAARGANMYRYVVKWEQLQKGLCTGDTTLDATALAAQDAAVAAITATGMDVLIDLHSYGAYNYNDTSLLPTCAVPPDDGKISSTTTKSYFVNYWVQMANHYASNPKVKFDIMNEPTAVTDAGMMSAAQAVIDGVRGAGRDNWIFVEFSRGNSACSDVARAFTASIPGTTMTVTGSASLIVGAVVSGPGVTPGTYIVSFGSGSGGAGTYNLNNSMTVGSQAMTYGSGPALLGLTDASNRTVLNCHQYITPCGYDACGATSNNGQGKSVLQNAVTFVKANNIKLFWGEAGIGAYGPQQYTESKNALDFMAANEDTGTGGTVGWNVWGSGTWGETYVFKQDPWDYTTPYPDRPTVRFLNTYFTGHSWKCSDGSTGTAGVCPGTWPAAQFP